MAEPQAFDPSQPFTVVSLGAHPEAKIGVPSPDTPVTLGDLMDNPVDAMKRIGANVKKEVTDPKTWLQVAALYFGPKVFNVAAPVVARAAASVGRGASAVSLKDVVDIVPGAKNVAAGVRTAQKVGVAMRTPTASPSAPSAAPVASAPAPATPVVEAPAPAAPPTPQAAPPSPQSGTGAPPPAAPAQGPRVDLPDQRALNEAALAARRLAYQQRLAAEAKAAPAEAQTPVAAAIKEKLTGAETKAFLDLMQRGMSSTDAMKNILLQRELQASLGLSTPTVAQTKFPKGMRGGQPK